MEQSLWFIHSPGMNEIGLVGLGYYYSQPLIQLLHHLKSIVSWVDPEGGGGTGGPNPPEKSQKYRSFGNACQITKLPSQHSILGHLIGMPGKRHLNGISLASR